MARLLYADDVTFTLHHLRIISDSSTHQQQASFVIVRVICTHFAKFAYKVKAVRTYISCNCYTYLTCSPDDWQNRYIEARHWAVSTSLCNEISRNTAILTLISEAVPFTVVYACY
jgi:hypothetical protein